MARYFTVYEQPRDGSTYIDIIYDKQPPKGATNVKDHGHYHWAWDDAIKRQGANPGFNVNDKVPAAAFADD